MNKYLYRKAVLEDLESIVRIYNSTIASRMVTADLEPVSVESRTSWFYNHTKDKPLWVVECSGEVVAWISLESFYGRSAYKHTAEVSIYISETQRGKGLGSKMITFVLEESKSLQIKTILGYIFAHNTPSIKLFEKFGFEKWAYLPKVAELEGVELDLVIVGKRIQ